MTRNEEKAHSMLNMFLTFKNEEKNKPKERHPFLFSKYHDLTKELVRYVVSKCIGAI